MESIAYVITNKFLILGFDGNLELSTSDMRLKIDRIKKAYKINETTIISIIGDLKKMTKLYRYVLELSKLNKDISTSQLIEDIKDLFPNGGEHLTHFIRQMTEIVTELQDKDSTPIDKTLLLQRLQNNEYLKSFTDKDGNFINPKTKQNYVFVFNYNDDTGINSTTLNIVGDFVVDPMVLDKTNINKNSFFIGAASSVQNEAKMIELRQKYVELLKPTFESGDWESQPDNLDLIDICKSHLKDIITEITPFDRVPDIYFYELGEHTQYKVVIPNVDLREINVNDV